MNKLSNYIFALTPLLPSAFLFWRSSSVLWLHVSSSITLGFVGFFLTNTFVPVVSEFTLKKGLCGKDMGRKGSKDENEDIPEALGIVAGTNFLICAIFSQLLYANTFQHQMVYNSALFSVCFMIFLGFTDDTLDLKWRYKLILPTIASLPLLSAYNGSTALYIPEKLQHFLMDGNQLTVLGKAIDIVATVDTEAHGAIVELGWLFLVFMGLLAVFCTNSINIYAGINGLEAGQSYVIACSILFFKLYEVSRGEFGENQIFSIVLILPFIGVTLALLRHNWFPAKVFVGDTYCYFAGMTFAVVGIHGHFSKTLLLLFIPQIFNFLYSLPQLFKLLPCPRHRLPRVDPKTQLRYYSAFPCKAEEFCWVKVRPDATECPNCTIINLVLRIFGPMRERSLTLILLVIQGLATILAFLVRYWLLENPNSLKVKL